MQHNTAPIRILVVDDHSIVRDGLTALLNGNKPMEVVAAVATGTEAVRVAEQLRPDVVVMDLGLPELSGTDATLRILAALPLTRIVILSVCDTAEQVFQALRAGARGYVVKASASTEIVNAVAAVFRGERYLSAKITGVVIDGLLSNPDLHSPLESLSGRVREVLSLTIDGATSAEIGTQLSLSRKTVDTYRSRAMTKLGVPDLAGLIRYAALHAVTPLLPTPAALQMCASARLEMTTETVIESRQLWLI
jgi:DNA-binding NarL/FixJ family response regulator